jgi:hypothetical protein
MAQLSGQNGMGEGRDVPWVWGAGRGTRGWGVIWRAAEGVNSDNFPYFEDGVWHGELLG